MSKVEWWISYCSEYPALYWARLRVFSDGSSDVAFEAAKVYVFDDRKYASNFLSEDEYMPFDSMDEQIESQIGAKKSEISPPAWMEDESAEIQYLGTY